MHLDHVNPNSSLPSHIVAHPPQPLRVLAGPKFVFSAAGRDCAWPCGAAVAGHRAIPGPKGMGKRAGLPTEEPPTPEPRLGGREPGGTPPPAPREPGEAGGSGTVAGLPRPGASSAGSRHRSRTIAMETGRAGVPPGGVPRPGLRVHGSAARPPGPAGLCAGSSAGPRPGAGSARGPPPASRRCGGRPGPRRARGSAGLGAAGGLCRVRERSACACGVGHAHTRRHADTRAHGRAHAPAAARPPSRRIQAGTEPPRARGCCRRLRPRRAGARPGRPPPSPL